MDPNKLKALMLVNGDTRNTLAEYLHISAASLSYKMNETHGRCFDKKEIEDIARKYSLTSKEISDIFFEDLVSKKDT